MPDNQRRVRHQPPAQHDTVQAGILGDEGGNVPKSVQVPVGADGIFGVLQGGGVPRVPDRQTVHILLDAGV